MNIQAIFWSAILAATSLGLAAPAAKGLPPGLYADIYTNKGLITCRLDFEKAPLTVTNFVGLAEGTKQHNRAGVKHFYDGLTFHRVVPGFVIQGGDPQGNGMGGPGYKFPDEINPELKHDKPGILAMANSGPNTNGSQFYITLAPEPNLDGKYNVFGSVVNGMDVVRAIQVGDKMDSVRIERMGANAKAFHATEAKFQALVKKVGGEKAHEEKPGEAKLAALEKRAKTTPSGLKYIITHPGSGPKPARGTLVTVHYTGTLANGKKFDSSRDRGRPFQFKVGLGMVIPGWDEAILDMRKGERRILIIPPNLAYGAQGAPPVIPPNATLIFDVELLDF